MIIFGPMGLVQWFKYLVLYFVFIRSSSFCLLTLSHSVECLCNPFQIYVNLFLCSNLFFALLAPFEVPFCGHLKPIFPQYLDYNDYISYQMTN